VKQLVGRGHQVTGTTRNASKAEQLRRMGASPVVMDGLNGAAIGRAVMEAQPEAIIHQMTALAGAADLRHFDRWFATTNELRTEGTDHLLSAARAVGTERFIAQSYTGWNNIRTGSRIKNEEDPFDPEPAREQRRSLAAIRYLEKTVLEAPIRSTVLRLGNLYGPGASEELVGLVRKRMLPIIGSGRGVWSWIHVDDAAAATVDALERSPGGTYNIVDDEPAEVSEWLPYLANVVGAKPPLRIPTWLGRLLAGEVAARWMTEGRGASNAKAKSELGTVLSWPTWRRGFRDGL
jgi:2-alkyl-3-oxoalkanoate reductase